MITHNEIQINIEDFKLIKSFYPEFRRNHANSNAFIIGWSELMPVVEKIDTLGYYVTIMRTRTIISKSVLAMEAITSIHPGYSMIEVLYCAVVEFIKWHNAQKP